MQMDTDLILVIFDLETSGFGTKADILQIAAKYGNEKFSVYVNPSQPIDSRASETNGLENRNGDLYFKGKKVDSIPIEEALSRFQQFLPNPCLLVAHSSGFDASHLIEAIVNNCMTEEFKKIAGFSNSLNLLKKSFPTRKGKGKFTLKNLANDFLSINSNDNFHDARYDVEILEQLISKYLNREDLVQNSKSYNDYVMINITLPSLNPLKGVVSDLILKKIAVTGTTLDILKDVFKETGRDGIFNFFTNRRENNKPFITNKKKVIDAINGFLSLNKEE